MENRRKFSRVPFSVKGELQWRGNKTHGEVSDLSLQGMFFRTQASCEPGETLEVTLHLAGKSSDLAIHVEGVVVRSARDGVALRFEHLDLDSFVHLRSILAYNTGDADKIDEEFMRYIKEKESFIIHKRCEPLEGA